MNNLKKTRNNLLKIIHDSNKRHIDEKRRYQLNRDIEIYVKDKPPKSVDMNKIIALIRDNIPALFLKKLKSVKIGQFDILKKRGISALHKDGHIYIDNNQDGEKNIIDDFVHEISLFSGKLIVLGDLMFNGMILPNRMFLGFRHPQVLLD